MTLQKAEQFIFEGEENILQAQGELIKAYLLSKLRKEVHTRQKRIELLLQNEAKSHDEKKVLEKKLNELQSHYSTTTKNFYKLLDETEELKKQQQHFRSEKSFYFQVTKNQPNQIIFIF